jgi:hypothetical protein
MKSMYQIILEYEVATTKQIWFSLVNPLIIYDTLSEINSVLDSLRPPSGEDGPTNG